MTLYLLQKQEESLTSPLENQKNTAAHCGYVQLLSVYFNES
jgi:hypothetical protein